VLNLSPVRPQLSARWREADYLIVNKVEFAQLVGEGSTIRTALPGAGEIVVTLGDQGLVAQLGGVLHERPAHRVVPVDTTGAGDCFCGVFAATLALGGTAEEAIDFANAAAGLSVRTTGAAPSMPYRDAVLRLLDSRAT